MLCNPATWCKTHQVVRHVKQHKFEPCGWHYTTTGGQPPRRTFCYPGGRLELPPLYFHALLSFPAVLQDSRRPGEEVNRYELRLFALYECRAVFLPYL